MVCPRIIKKSRVLLYSKNLKYFMANTLYAVMLHTDIDTENRFSLTFFICKMIFSISCLMLSRQLFREFFRF